VTEGRKVPLTIRIPDELRRKLVRMAKAHGMSLNAEILQRLQSSLDANGTVAAAKPLLDELRALLAEVRRGRKDSAEI
jgi:predicted transcriptional regulator